MLVASGLREWNIDVNGAGHHDLNILFFSAEGGGKMHYSNFRYLGIWFCLAMCCVLPESDVAAGKSTQASTMLKGGPLLSKVVVSWRCAGRVES